MPRPQVPSPLPGQLRELEFVFLGLLFLGEGYVGAPERVMFSERVRRCHREWGSPKGRGVN